MSRNRGNIQAFEKKLFARRTVKEQGAAITGNCFILLQIGRSAAENRVGHCENSFLKPPEKVIPFLVNPPRKVGNL